MTAPTPPSFLVHPSPVGDILIVVAGDALVTLHPFDGPLGAELEAVGRRLGAIPEPGSTDAAAAATEQLDAYFDGDLMDFDLPLDWRLVRGFTRDALHAVLEIPYGETAGYGEVAAMAGVDRAGRAVGTACASTPFSIVVPVHRVVRADGSIGEYGGRPDIKRFLLDHERSTLVARGVHSAAVPGAGE